jgi:hypothetical protein
VPDASLDAFARVATLGRHLCVLSTSRRDGTIQSSLVSAGVVDHPLTGRPAAGLVALGRAHKLANLRARRQATLVAQAGGEWVAVEGDVDLFGPDDGTEAIDGERRRLLLRDVFVAAGGTHDDWATYDRVMADERRTTVLITPGRVYTNG